MNTFSLFKGMRLTDPIRVVKRLVQVTSQAFPGTRWDEVNSLLKNNDFDAITALSIEPSAYSDHRAFFVDYQAISFLRKADFLPTTFDRATNAYRKFYEYEEHCRLTNRRIRLSDPTGRVADIMSSARGKIRSLLGDAPSTFDLEAIRANSGWGHGSTSTVKGAEVSLYHKLRAPLEATPGLHALGTTFITSCIPSWQREHLESEVTCVPGNVICTVPKDAKTDRTIAVEPHVNAFFQKGIGTVLRKRLRKWGVDLHSQERNQQLAFEGSCSGMLATVDLSGASDCISKALVEWILPPAWVALLSLTRSENYLHNGEWKTYHKWSSMGNGYTFELETLIFYAIAFASTRYHCLETDKVSCYGDDIIVPVQCVPDLFDTLEWCGFSVNAEKSYYSPFTFFRESCGKDYLAGNLVRPMFVKNLGHVTNLYNLINKMLIVSAVEPVFKTIRERAISFVPDSLRYFVPKGLSDGGIHMDVGEWFTRSFGQNVVPKGAFGLLSVRHLVWTSEQRPVPDDESGLGWALAMGAEPSVYDVLHHKLKPSDGQRVVDMRNKGRWVRRRLTFSESAIT